MRERPCAVVLLNQVLATGEATIDDVGAALLVPATTITAYRTGRRVMSLERQLLLAVFAIELDPYHARLGHRLRGQIGARIAFDAGETVRHSTPPAHW